eukprot:192351-Amphidinium_carterae.1
MLFQCLSFHNFLLVFPLVCLHQLSVNPPILDASLAEYSSNVDYAWVADAFASIANSSISAAMVDLAL